MENTQCEQLFTAKLFGRQTQHAYETLGVLTNKSKWFNRHDFSWQILGKTCIQRRILFAIKHVTDYSFFDHAHSSNHRF